MKLVFIKYISIKYFCHQLTRLAQSVERTTLNRVVEGSTPSLGDTFFHNTLQ